MNVKNIMKYILLLTFSGYIYVCLELIFRGHSDITMMYAASICVIPMILLNNYFSNAIIEFLVVIYISSVVFSSSIIISSKVALLAKISAP